MTHGTRCKNMETGGLVEYMDDGDILCHPILLPSYLREFDVANAKVGAERNPQKTEVIHCVDDLGAAPPGCRGGDVQNMATVSIVTVGSVTLGVFITDQLLAKADVIRAMHERESPGVSRINHILRVHGHEQQAAETYDEVGQLSLERLLPGFTEDSLVQATLSAGQSKIGKRARDIAAPTRPSAATAPGRSCWGFHHRPLAWTADWRPHPAVTRTSSRNSQQMSAKSLQRLWKHEIQIALRSHDTSRSAEPFSTGRVAAIPDDDHDIASFASQPSASLQPSSF